MRSAKSRSRVRSRAASAGSGWPSSVTAAALAAGRYTSPVVFGGTVTVISMGPPKAAEALTECVEQGADRAILITDRKGIVIAREG